MSLPFYKITCSNCEYTDGYNFGVNYKYKGIKEYEPLLRIGWCRNCDKIRKVLSPFTLEDAKAEIEDLNLWIKRNQEGLFAKYSKSKRIEVLEAEKEIGEIKARFRNFENHPYKDICLTCKSHEVFPFFLPSQGEVELQIKHTCGGNLRIKEEGRLSFSNQQQVIYDENANILSDTRTHQQKKPTENTQQTENINEIDIKVMVLEKQLESILSFVPYNLYFEFFLASYAHFDNAFINSDVSDKDFMEYFSSTMGRLHSNKHTIDPNEYHKAFVSFIEKHINTNFSNITNSELEIMQMGSKISNGPMGNMAITAFFMQG